MTAGALIFAFDNEETDYVSMAAWSAKNIHKHLRLPVAVVTDIDPGDSRVSGFDRVIPGSPHTGGTRYFEDYQATVSWHNAGRVDAYSLSPWDETLVLDADYVVASNELNKLWNNSADFMCHRSAYNMASASFMTELNQFGEHGLPMWWATVMMFRKSNTAQYIFDCMQMVKENWQHYRDLYGIQKSTYRNDFALSIALGIVSGHTGVVDEIPWPLCSVTPDTRLTRTMFDNTPGNRDSYTLEYIDTTKQTKTLMFGGLDFHAMGKRDLGEIVETDRRAGLLDSSAKHQ